MSIRNLDRLFQPRSVAVIGASDNPQRIGTRVLANLAQGGFARGGGAIWPLNPKYQMLHDMPCYARVAALPSAPDLAIVCSPPSTIPGVIAELGARGTRAAIVMTAGLDGLRAGSRSVQQAMLDAARPYLMRILGPGSVGLQSPAAGLNASFTHIAADAGKLAFVSQSGALGTAVLDWASLRGIGFSRFVTMGGVADVDFGDLLDYLAGDVETEAILLCIEDVSNARKFMSAGRLAARGKPVIVLKVGRDAAPGADLVFDAAIRRAGMLRVHSTEDLFDAVETLARQRPQRGERLAVLTNGVGLGLIAADALECSGARLAPLSAETQRLLKRADAPLDNPVNLLADVPVERYTSAVEALLRESQADALLFLHAPTAMVDSGRIAAAVAPLMRSASKNVLSCWLGGRSVAAARQLFADAGLPTYDTPEKAVHGFLQIAQYRRNQELLMEVPARLPATSAPERAAARVLVAAALASGRGALSDQDARALLSAYGIALATPQQAALTGHTLAAARIQTGTDPVFGPVVFFGQGGIAAEVAADRAAGLPPLNMVLARDMVGRTRVARLLAQGQTEADADALCRTLVQVADMVADLPQLAELDLNPLLAIGGAVVALAAQVRLAPARAGGALAIRPYPLELEQELDWQGGRILLRPIRPEDAPQHQVFFAALDPDDVRLRFFTAMRELPPSQLARLTQIDYDRAMAFIATRNGANGEPETLGVVRAVADADNQSAEFAIIVRSDLKGKGLGYILFQKLVDYFRSQGTGEIVGDALAENFGVQKLVRHFGGVVLPHPEAGMVRLQLPLR
ncbi:GNAT family N-acetyltransferase [Duganella sp. BJB488]|uniref:bifunctional acetate--CoA ligase family protein/GNAT family N-acetyltransferase n=1 Tax=unclassified Duganella TaxID=2636909 RepID=UPI000E343708|nr:MULTISPECIES: GNAT family N-acetyltransferase [unclassified Duganella]RFP20181.1 GNAT family N-acetyltransferase [Duganella sp. BJB489]RFP21371.1 GNAT family N-acetyltransferase [Duganella sp. BJB488]RFP33512.1 GNAT family N-acetyltransferase [Duganella sp. BJB480]